MKINDININYFDSKQGKNPVLILHGWGSSTKVMQNMYEHLSNNHRVIMLDLPGFGETSEPDYGWNLDNYVDFIILFMEKLKIDNPTIIGHSFGGRIAIKLASTHKEVKLNKIILIDSAGIKRDKKSLKKKLIKSMAKILKVISPKLVSNLKNKIGSPDYKNASPIMKEVLVNIIEEDLTNYLEEIKQPTLLIWGEFDKETPYEDAVIMNEKIKDSGIVKINKAGHYSFLDNSYLVHSVIDVFLGDDKK